MSRSYDYAVVGAGIVGLATAWQLQRARPDAGIVVLEKEPEPALHQTGRNSGVIHSGIYYTPGSLKARNCRRGKALLEAFCGEHAIPYERCGKVIVATREEELPRLVALCERGRENGVDCALIERERLTELEPEAAGLRAIHVPEAGIVDYRAVSRKLLELLEAGGAELRTKTRLVGVRRAGDGLTLQTGAGELRAGHLVTCAGLHSDRVARASGDRPPARIVPFRGEYYELIPDARHLCRGLIYPVPQPGMPFLGVHLTKTIDGGVECGPNAVLALAREGYTWTDVSPRDLLETLTYGGALRLFAKHWRVGVGEVWRSLSKGAFVRDLRRLAPALRGDQLVVRPAGVRAQAVAPDGGMVDDFVIVGEGRVTHVCNAPSPAATSSLAIGETIARRVLGAG